MRLVLFLLFLQSLIGIPTNLLAKLPLKVEGGLMGGGRAPIELARTVSFPSPGVYYLWLRANNQGASPVVLRYRLAKDAPLRSKRGQIEIKARSGKDWFRATPYREFDAQVHVPRAGSYEFRLKLDKSDNKEPLQVDGIFFSLFHAAVPEGETLNHDLDPGHGRDLFTAVNVNADGYREDWRSPEPSRLSAYFVDSEAGNDANDGRSEKTAWKSFSKVNALTLQPGNALLLKRGGRWDQGLRPRGSGNAKARIVLGAYGVGAKPSIHGREENALKLENQHWWTIQDIEVSAESNQVNEADWKAPGLDAMAVKATGGGRLQGIRIFNVTAFDSPGVGIHVGSDWEKGPGVEGLLIQNCLSYFNEKGGIVVEATRQGDNRNCIIRSCTVYGCDGVGGIYFHSGQNSLIDYCRAYNSHLNIWIWNCNNVTIRYCEAYRGHTDGERGGFDLDFSCNACTLEYCYAHHNEGYGIMLMGAGTGYGLGNTPNQDRYNILRYCIAAEDKMPFWIIETFEHGKVYNNLCIARGKGGKALEVSGWPESSHNDNGGWPENNEFFNNICLGVDGAIPLFVDGPASRQNNRFDYNDLIRLGTDPAPLVRWGGTWRNSLAGRVQNTGDPAKEFQDVEAFRKDTGNEAHGISRDPLLADPRSSPLGRRPMDQLRPNVSLSGKKRSEALEPAWLTARNRYLQDTGAEKYGIPMQPGVPDKDYWGRKIVVNEAMGP